jgi:hypothetical protein
MRVVNLFFGAVTSSVGLFLLSRRHVIAQDYINAYNRTPEQFGGIDTAWFGLFGFKTFEAFVKANVTSVAVIFLTLGVLSLVFFVSRIMRGI